MRDSSRNTPLAPSTEKAYHQKCVELKRRLREIEDANDAARVRKRRIDRAIMKMRLERAFLLERLAKAQNQPSLPDGAAAASDKSTSPPQTPQERAPRVRRQYPKSPPQEPSTGPAPASGRRSPSHSHGAYASSRHHSQADYPPQPAPLGYPSRGESSPVGGSAYPPSSRGRDAPPPPPTTQQQHYTGPAIDRRAPSQIPFDEPLPLISSLPNGTNVVITDGQPKQPPWTIRDVEPRHHLDAEFERLPAEQQLEQVMVHGYTPYDVHGHPVVLHQDGERIRHVFRDDPEWVDPVTNNVRMDDPWRAKREVRGVGGAALARRASDGGEDGGGASLRRSASARRDDKAAPADNGGGFTAVNRT